MLVKVELRDGSCHTMRVIEDQVQDPEWLQTLQKTNTFFFTLMDNRQMLAFPADAVLKIHMVNTHLMPKEFVGPMQERADLQRAFEDVELEHLDEDEIDDFFDQMINGHDPDDDNDFDPKIKT